MYLLQSLCFLYILGTSCVYVSYFICGLWKFRIFCLIYPLPSTALFASFVCLLVCWCVRSRTQWHSLSANAHKYADSKYTHKRHNTRTHILDFILPLDFAKFSLILCILPFHLPPSVSPIYFHTPKRWNVFFKIATNLNGGNLFENLDKYLCAFFITSNICKS